jgi:hypothetical protein
MKRAKQVRRDEHRQNVESSCTVDSSARTSSTLNIWEIGDREIPTLVLNEHYEIIRKKVLRGEKEASALR